MKYKLSVCALLFYAWLYAMAAATGFENKASIRVTGRNQKLSQLSGFELFSTAAEQFQCAMLEAFCP